MSSPGINFALEYGPGLMGLALGFAVYGAALGQYAFYLFAFPFDHRALKVLVLLLFVMDALHTYGMAGWNWVLLVSCHHVATQDPVFPWQGTMAGICSFCITMLVQSFYAHRLWIISGHNKLVVAVVLATALAGFVLGLLGISLIVRAGSPTAERIILVVISSACGVSMLCDVIITASIFFYLRPQRSGIKRVGTAVQQLIDVFIRMGLLTCLVSLSVFVMLWIKDGQYWLLVFPPLVCKSYAHSLLAVLNARKSIREGAMKTIQLPTLSVAWPATAEIPSSGSSRGDLDR
ncbi:hypothetical protein BV22DRAFT_1195004 [Leucogyrophana mollusca]|uniref:Uncharacterized protein n=1 Tax=Leucogyrophana mollusca TaxID=85980 RepID=A0ACB8BID0_9AGAM|nr:hypothetical protein BV22DRAFT_1195004 [Leucogyrophana mollusca]